VSEASKCSHRRWHASAVWFVGAMGLLDDAIREHLELKRRRGADPGEVAREQREALESAPRGEAAGAGRDIAVAESVAVDKGTVGVADVASVSADGATSIRAEREDAPDVASRGAPDSVDPSNVVQETAELDMVTVLDGHDDAAVADAGEHPDEDSLEWEIPRGAEVEPQADVGHGEHDAAGTAYVVEPSEDVLEETPDFLRDTPEQDRLWFEQRPPRDFDFDK